MGFLDKAKAAATKAVDQHGDKIKQGSEKLAKVVDDKTDRKHTDKIAKGRQKLEDSLDKLDGKNDDFPKDGRAR